jgi:hypothetical protein
MGTTSASSFYPCNGKHAKAQERAVRIYQNQS